MKRKNRKKISAKRRTKKPAKKILAKAKKITKAELKKEFAEERVDALLKKGKERGFLTYAEILVAFTHIEYNVVFLEDLYARLESAGVDVLEGRELLEWPKPRAERKSTRLNSSHSSISY